MVLRLVSSNPIQPTNWRNCPTATKKILKTHPHHTMKSRPAKGNNIENRESIKNIISKHAKPTIHNPQSVVRKTRKSPESRRKCPPKKPKKYQVIRRNFAVEKSMPMMFFYDDTERSLVG